MIHISIVRKILEEGQPVDLKVINKKGEIISYKNIVSISSHFRGGTRNIKSLTSNEIRKIRDVCIIEINDEEVYL